MLELVRTRVEDRWMRMHRSVPRWLVVGMCCGAVGVIAQEKLALTTPVSPPAPTTRDYTVRRLVLAWDEQQIQIMLRDNNNQITHYLYTGAQATTLMVALNTANLATKSLQRRILEQLVADGKLTRGTVTGAPK